MIKCKCIVCYRELENLDLEDGFQPDDGLAFASAGHYGTAVFDPMDDSHIHIAVCDPCLEQARADGVIAYSDPIAPRRLSLKVWK